MHLEADKLGRHITECLGGLFLKEDSRGERSQLATQGQMMQPRHLFFDCGEQILNATKVPGLFFHMDLATYAVCP